MDRGSSYLTLFFLFLVTVCAAEFELPHDMRELRDYELHQMTSCPQKGPSCAWYATLNAYAMQELYRLHIPLTDENIQQHVTCIGLPFIKNHEQHLKQAMGEPIFEGLYGKQQDYLARFLGLANYYLLQLEDGLIWYLHKGQWRLYTNVEPLLKEIKYDRTPLIHILLSMPVGTTYHAVSISRIRRHAPKPFLFYVDSNNTPLYQKSCEVIQEPCWGGLFTKSYLVTYQYGYDEHSVKEYVCSFIKRLDTL